MTRAWSDPPIGPYHRVPVQVHQADPHAPEVARRLIALIGTRWPATPAEHVGSTAVPGLAGKNIIDLLLAAEPTHIPAITQALLELGLQPQSPAAFPATRPMLWGAFRHGATEYPVHVHVVPASSAEVAAMRGFRDALRADPVLRRRYAALKRAIVAGGPVAPVAFTRAKHDWIAAALGQLGLADDQPRRLYQDDLNRTGRAYCTPQPPSRAEPGPADSTATVLPLRRHRAPIAEDNASYSSTAAISALAASRREGKHMHNQHAGLSQQLAAQRITERQEQAAQARLAYGAGRPRRRRRWLARRWWLLGRRPGVAIQPADRQPHPVR